MSGQQLQRVLAMAVVVACTQGSEAQTLPSDGSRCTRGGAAGLGVRVRGAVRADVARFERMLLDGIAGSATMRELVVEIACDRDAAHAFEVVVGRNEPGVFVDSAATGWVDLEDLERLPSARDPGRERNEVTREELIVHVLSERRHLRRMASRLPAATAAARREELFAAAHEVGLYQENRYRAERGQVALTAAVNHAVANTPGAAVVEYSLEDGTVSLIVTRHHGQIERIVPPFDRAEGARLSASAGAGSRTR